MKPHFLFVALVFTLITATHITHAQSLVSDNWTPIETAISTKKNLEETQSQVIKGQSGARSKGNDIEFARYAYYNMQIKDLKTEDSLYFRNSAFMDSILLVDHSSNTLKAVIHLLQARRLDQFQRKNLRFRQSTYETRNLKYNYAAMNPKQIDSVIRDHFNILILLSPALSPIKEDISWLSSNAKQLPFKPDLIDLSISENIGYETKNKNQTISITAQQAASLIRSKPEELHRELHKIVLSKTEDKHLIKCYLDWMEKYSARPEKSLYIQALFKYLLYSQNYRIDDVKIAWKKYLQENLNSKYNLLNATAAYHLFLIHYLNGIKYGAKFETQYKGELRLAVKLYDQHKEALAQFPVYWEHLTVLLKKINAREFQFQSQDKHLPDQPILITGKYRNISKVYYRIIKVGVEEQLSEKNRTLINTLLHKPAFRDSTFSLPLLTEDYDKHAAYLKLEALPPGAYYLLSSVKEIENNSDFSAMEIHPFVVTNLVAVNHGERFMVLNRKTGMPISNVTVSASYKPNNYNKITSKLFHSDSRGFVQIGDRKANRLLLSLKGDSLLHEYEYSTLNQQLKIYNKEEYDDLDEFYDDKASVAIYIDRSIYRPGQRVFYKAILLTENPISGVNEVFSKATNSHFKKWLLQNKSQLYLQNPSGQVLDSIKLDPDAYGSTSGSFLLPKNAIPGSWKIDCRFLNTNDLHFKVEEYKRPSLEMTMEKPKEQPMPGEPFELKIKIRSFSGAAIQNVKIEYTLERNTSPYIKYAGTNIELLDTLGYTDEKGELLIRVKESINLDSLNTKEQEQQFNYRLEAVATESTGESTTLEAEYLISSWPVKINATMARIYDKKKLPVLTISAQSEIKRYQPDQLDISVYQLVKVTDSNTYKEVDQWIYPVSDLKRWFPNLEIFAAPKEEKRKIERRIIDAKAKYEFNKDLLPAGVYELVISTKKSDQLSGKYIGNFEIFDTETETVPAALKDFSYLPENIVSAGDHLNYYSASVDKAYVTYSLTYYVKTAKGLTVKTTYDQQHQPKGLQSYPLIIPKNAVDQLIFTKLYVLNNQLYKNQEYLYLNSDVKAEPEIIIEKYRKILAPGAKETFSISIKTAKENIAAQLMTVMYDASLDLLEPHYWNNPIMNNNYRPFYSLWSHQISQTKNSIANESRWFTNDLYINDFDIYQNEFNYQLQGKVAGLSIGGTPGASNSLQEVVVMRGYSSTSIKIRGTSTLNTNKTLVILDGLPYTGSMDQLGSDLDVMQLKGAEATALYGAQAAEGVLIISTKGKIILPNVSEPQAVIRKDFNETAFFYPNIYADKNGLYTFSFTMPQTATAWNWKMLAHTQKGLFAYAERKLHTQLSLMVQPNMPRLLYQGDELFLKSRISNLDTAGMELKLSCSIEDAVTGEVLTTKIISREAIKSIKIGAKQTTSAGFYLKVPEGQLNPLKIVTTVTGGSFADAEEHTLPILPRKIFVRQQIPIAFSKKDSLIKVPALPKDAEIYGLSLFVDPKPQAAVLNSLPYLMNYPYDCAEQTFNKVFAIYMAKKLIKTDAAIGMSFKMASKKNATDTSSQPTILPDELTEAAMPWLNLNNRTKKQQNLLYEALDTLANAKKLVKHLEKLYKMQNGDGGLPWFEGGQNNNWISNYLINGFGKLHQEGWKAPNPVSHEEFIKKMIAYADLHFMNNKVSAPLYYAYARSWWKEQYPIAPLVSKQIKETIDLGIKTEAKNSLYDQALWINTASKYTNSNEPIFSKIESQRKHILQQAIKDEQHGLRWKEIADADQLDNSKEETIAMLFEAFPDDKSVKEGMLKWILSTRQDNNWASTVGTAAAINMIGSSTEITSGFQADTLQAKVADQNISLSNDLLTGTSTKFVPLSAPLTINTSTKQAVAGGLTWFYFSGSSPIDTLNRKVKLCKKLFIFEQKQAVWSELKPGIGVKVGDKIKVVLTVESQKPLRFLQVEDKRAGAFEPIDNNSGQKYVNGIPHYLAIRDSGQQFFIDFLPSGRSEFSYEVRVSQEGNFRNGSAMLQCLYQPGITAYSNSMNIISKTK
ncbi:MG2 domain-containing protein [Pedobacter gandavensis]|uniref:alpha-2-macroglobulin family protein n=1 Tax=Pedobacter gandavensis TaxID=2679963 RepID=UPI0029313170|nr:MG2 domain-containing protein [Pedobacter gandavensis]